MTLRMRRKNDVSTLRYARSFERLQLRTSGFKYCYESFLTDRGKFVFVNVDFTVYNDA